MKLDIIIEETGATTMHAKDVQNAVRDQLHGAGEHWHKNFRKRHFHTIAFSIYRYTPRSRGYDFRKMRKLGHRFPLVFSGVSKRLSEGKTIRATDKQVDVVMGTRAFNFKNPRSNINMRDEFTQINEQEHAEIDARMERGLRKTLLNWRGKRRSTLRDERGRFIKG